MTENAHSLLSFTQQRPTNPENIIILEAEIKASKRGSRKQTFGRKHQECIGYNPDVPSFEAKNYDPMKEEPGLYRIAANAGPTEKGALEFCREWGLLNLGSAGVLKDCADTRWRFVDMVSEAIGLFQNLKFLSGLLDTIKHYDLEYGVNNWPRHLHGIKQISWETKGAQRCVSGAWENGRSVTIAHNFREFEEFPDTIRWKNNRSALYYLLITEVNKQLAHHTQASVLYINDEYKPKHLWNKGCFIRPKSLAGVLWYQLADEIQGGRSAYSCAVCGQPFVNTSKPRGKLPKFCSNNCRQKNHRLKKLPSTT